jgi:hypothetical protein
MNLFLSAKARFDRGPGKKLKREYLPREAANALEADKGSTALAEPSAEEWEFPATIRRLLTGLQRESRRDTLSCPHQPV